MSHAAGELSLLCEELQVGHVRSKIGVGMKDVPRFFGVTCQSVKQLHSGGCIALCKISHVFRDVPLLPSFGDRFVPSSTSTSSPPPFKDDLSCSHTADPEQVLQFETECMLLGNVQLSVELSQATLHFLHAAKTSKAACS